MQQEVRHLQIRDHRNEASPKISQQQPIPPASGHLLQVLSDFQPEIRLQLTNDQLASCYPIKHRAEVDPGEQCGGR